MANNANYQLDDWVGAVRADPRNTDQLTVLQGYLGASSEADHVRVYSDESLNSFVEVPKSAIVHAVKLTETESSLGGSRLWLRADSVVTYGDPRAANRPKSTFLEGDIMQQYGAFGNIAPAGGFMGGQGDTTGQIQGMGPVSVPINTCPILKSQPITTCIQLISQTPANCPILRTIRRSVCIVCFTLPAQTTCQPITCFGRTITVTFPSVGGCPSLAGCPSTFCGPGGGIPGGPVINPGGGFMGQPDTTQMGGYYGAFNPYMY